MKERPILFSAPMVRAILEGRKTVTRRILKVQPDPYTTEFTRMGGLWVPTATGQNSSIVSGKATPCPYGQPGDQLWVRETWHNVNPVDDCLPPREMRGRRAIYQATEVPGGAGDSSVRRWRPSIHMPRWASRLSLEVTGVRVERLQDITAEEAIAEGIEWFDDFRINDKLPPIGFRALWESINGASSWASNPWVWAVSFRRLP